MRDHAPAVVAMVERERQRDPANAVREYDALFADGASTLLRSADVDACTDALDARPPRRGLVYGVTLDVGLRNDSTAIMAFHVERIRRPGAPPVRMLVVDCVRVLKPQPGERVTLDAVERAVADVCARYRVAKVHADLHYADAIAPRLRSRGLVFVEMKMSAPEQEKRGTSLVARFTGRTVRLVREPTLLRELKGLRLTRHAGGRVSIGAPESKRKHDDAADCLLLACEVESGLPAIGGDVDCETRVRWDESGLTARTSWFERLPNGRRIPCEPPIGSPDYAAWAEEMIASGHTTPSIERWREEQAAAE
jgi:hypothetical protein